MKLIIIEGLDRTGKSTLIKNFCEYFNYDNVTVRHFDKPRPFKKLSLLEVQENNFHFECRLLKDLKQIEDGQHKGYYENVVIWNRSHLGEYIYGQLYRGLAEGKVVELIQKIHNVLNLMGVDEIHYVYLHGDADFLTLNEDGNSFGKLISDKQKELNMFDEVFSIFNLNVNRIKVNEGMSYIDSNEIFKTIINKIGLNEKSS